MVLYPLLARWFSCSLPIIYILKVTIRKWFALSHSKRSTLKRQLGKSFSLGSCPPPWTARVYLSSQSPFLLVSTKVSTKLCWYCDYEDVMMKIIMMKTNTSWDFTEIFYTKAQVILKVWHSVIQITSLESSSSNLNQLTYKILVHPTIL